MTPESELRHTEKPVISEALRRKAEAISLVMGGDYNMTVGLGPWGGGWNWDFVKNHVNMDPKDLATRPENENKGTAAHEGFHKDQSFPEYFMDIWGEPGVSFGINADEDPRVNHGGIAKNPGTGEWIDAYIERDLGPGGGLDYQGIKKDAQNTLGYVPKFMQGGAEAIRYWYEKDRKGLIRTKEDTEKFISQIPDDQVREYMKKTIDAHEEYYETISRSHDRMEKKKAAKQAADIFKDKILPDFRTLVEQSMKDQSMVNMLEDMMSQGTPQQGQGGQMIAVPFESLPKEIQDEIKEKVKEMKEKAKKDKQSKSKQDQGQGQKKQGEQGQGEQDEKQGQDGAGSGQSGQEKQESGQGDQQGQEGEGQSGQGQQQSQQGSGQQQSGQGQSGSGQENQEGQESQSGQGQQGQSSQQAGREQSRESQSGAGQQGQEKQDQEAGESGGSQAQGQDQDSSGGKQSSQGEGSQDQAAEQGEEGDEGQADKIPWDQLSEKAKKEVEKAYDKLPDEKKEEYKEKAKEALENAEDAANEKLRGKMSDPRQTETHKEKRERQQKESQRQKDEMKNRQKIEDMERRREEAMSQIEEDDYHYFQTLPEVAAMFREGDRQFKKIFDPNEDPDTPRYSYTGLRPSMRKAMQYEADPRKSNIFEVKKRPEAKNYRFLILADLSGSMRYNVDEVFKIIVRNSELMNKHGIEFSIIGFTDTFDKNIKVYKYFDEKKLNQPIRRRIGEFRNEQMGGTPTYSATNKAHEILLERMKKDPKSNNYFITFTDGQPTDCGEGDLLELINGIRKDKRIVTSGFGFGPGTEFTDRSYPPLHRQVKAEIARVLGKNPDEIGNSFTDAMEFSKAFDIILLNMVKHRELFFRT